MVGIAKICLFETFKRVKNYMACKVKIDTERCKGCGLCVTVCPNGSIAISKHSNKSGYFPAQANNNDCTGCSMCALVCPETIIEVYRDIAVVAIEAGKKTRLRLSEEKV